MPTAVVLNLADHSRKAGLVQVKSRNILRATPHAQTFIVTQHRYLRYQNRYSGLPRIHCDTQKEIYIPITSNRKMHFHMKKMVPEWELFQN